MKTNLKAYAATSVLFLSATVTHAAMINQVDYFSLSGNVLIDFESVAGGAAPGTNYDGVIDLVGASFAEKFDGQTLSTSGNSDILSGTPTGGALTLSVGAAGRNLNVFTYGGDGNVLTGLGHLGWPNFDAIGEGAVAILFDNDQSEFGFQSVGGNLGSAVFEFWARDGSLLDTIMPTSLGTDYFGFAREGGLQDIAGISIYNTDPAGIGFDDIIFDVPGPDDPRNVPEPPALVLLLLGLLGLRFSTRLTKAC
ncbi:hypothetical protein EUZ85_29030 [Hahella sp. KA22]|uniref:hypothetical protein n=1 Tax=Hahella sp. KA22 TaxID=1628392 RepID=UPI000FDF5C8A|nr:hypothetical protein [Hahella sp. KA22]AZZ94541.1 hypothetical protein ENC22_26445 [Hahella sp. KA22]QAY57914.1 hypothetical protein EUZ85_29030 [Hahella sp. KA22]